MTNEIIAIIRRRYSNKKLVVVADNMRTYYEDYDGNTFIIDPTNQLVHSIRLNSVSSDPKTKFELSTFEIDNIQYVNASVSAEDVLSTLNVLKTDGVITDVELAALRAKLKV